MDNISASVDVPICTYIRHTRATEEDPELKMLQKYIIIGWPHTKVVEAGVEKILSDKE